MRRRAVTFPTLLVVMALVAGACTGDDSTETTLESTPEARALMESALGTQAVQDFMIHLEMFIFDDDSFVSVLDQVVDRAHVGAGETVRLGDGFVFTPVDSLDGRMVDGDGEVMSSLSVDFGLMAMTDDLAHQVEDELRAELAGSEEGEQIADLLFGAGVTRDGVLVEIVTASYDQAYVHAGFDDAAEMDLSFLTIPDGAEMMVVHLFGLTLPGDPVAEAGLTPHQLFEYRWNRGLIQFLLDDNQYPEIITGAAQLQTTPPPQSQNRTPTHIQTAAVTGPGILHLATDEPSDAERAGEALREGFDNFSKYLMKEQAFREAMREAFEQGEAAGIEKALWLAGIERWNRARGFTPAVGMSMTTQPDGSFVCLASFEEGTVVLITTESNPFLPYEPPLEGWPPECGRPERVTPETFATRWGLAIATLRCDEIRNRIFGENNPATAVTGKPSEEVTATDTTVTTVPFTSTTSEPPPSPACDPPPESTGGVWGDVHMITVDGFTYPNQAAGEFLVFDNGAATIQMRTAPWKDSGWVSVVTALAVRIGDSTVSMHDGGDTWVDGDLAELEVGVPVAVGDGSLVWTGDSWAVVWADGTELKVVDTRPGMTSSMFFMVTPSQLPLTGMLGTPNGDHYDDLVIRGSDEVWPALTSKDEEFYATFIDSWRISEDESLFHYGPGETTAGFHLEGFPSWHVTVGELDFGERALAEEACQRAGVTRQDILDACIFDVTITGDPGFIYAHSVMNATLPDPASPDLATPPPPPIDAEQFVVIGPVALDIGPEPPLQDPDAFSRRSCTLSSDGEAFSADIAYQTPDQSVNVDINFAAASVHPSGEDSLVVVVKLNSRERAWMTTVNTQMGRIDSLSFDGTNLAVTGAGFFKADPSNLALGPLSALPPGATLSPFTLQFSCAP